MLILQLTVQKISLKLEENEYKRSHMTASCFGTIFLWDISQTEGIELNSLGAKCCLFTVQISDVY